jgi:hypothetical protein
MCVSPSPITTETAGGDWNLKFLLFCFFMCAYDDLVDTAHDSAANGLVGEPLGYLCSCDGAFPAGMCWRFNDLEEKIKKKEKEKKNEEQEQENARLEEQRQKQKNTNKRRTVTRR